MPEHAHVVDVQGPEEGEGEVGEDEGGKEEPVGEVEDKGLQQHQDPQQPERRVGREGGVRVAELVDLEVAKQAQDVPAIKTVLSKKVTSSVS